ncbi:MAG: amino acid permease [Deltaproteobacteria bacterium]|nr:amino acid permease [Deltaproteobacteria bacterium]
MIGSGIFIVSAQMTRELGSAGWLLAVWALAGTMTVVAAALYGNLVARFPRAGGQYVYLREAFGPFVGFLYGWTLFLVIQTGTIAAVAVAFARFTAVLIPGMDGTDLVPGLSLERALAIALIAVLTAANCRGVEVGKTIQNVFTIAKIAALVAVIALCAVAGSGGMLARNLGAPFARAPLAELSLAGAIGSAMVGALFSADAWNNVTFAAEEVRDPERTIPRALVAGTALVILIYLAANVAYLLVLPALGSADAADPLARGIAYAARDRVATAVMQTLFGPVGVVAMAVAIMISTFGCVNGLILSGARVSYAMARDDLFFAAAGRLSRAGAPAFALVVQGLWAAVLALSGTYGDLLDYVIFAALLFYALTVAATLRYGDRDRVLPRVLAVGYVIAAAAVMLDLLVVKPRFTWPGLLIVLSGAPVYAWWTRTRDARRAGR